MRKAIPATTLFALSVGLLLPAGAARGYVRTTSQHSGAAVAWLESCVTVSADQRGSVDVPLDLIDATLARAAANWTSRTGGCGYLQLIALPASRVLDVAADGQNIVVFRQDKWQRPSGMPHDPGAIGLTTVFYVDAPGQVGDASILDADIELNGVNFTFTTNPAGATARPGTVVADLENTLTHELGHVQGLAHNCWDHLTDTPPIDDRGNPIPDCTGSLSPAITAATMFPYAKTGEITKRMLSPDDVDGICKVYAPTETPPACNLQVQSGCEVARGGRRAVAGAHGGAAALVAGLGALAVAIAWRRRRRA